MAAPRITVTADFESEHTLGTLSVLSLAYGFHQLWIYTVMFGYTSLLGLEPLLFVENTQISVSLTTLVSMLVLALVLLFYAVTDQRFLKTYVSKRYLLVGAAAMAVGTFIACLTPLLGRLGFLTEFVAGLLTGWGSGTLLIYMGTSFARMDGMSIAINTALAMLFAIVAYGLVLNFLPAIASKVIIVLLPVAEVGLLLSNLPTPFFERHEWPMFDALPENKPKFCLMFGLYAVLLGLVIGLLRQSAIQAVMPGASVLNLLGVLGAAICASALILLATMLTSNGRSWDRLLRFMVPLVGFGLLFISAVHVQEFSAASFFLLIAYISAEALYWIFIGEIAHRYRLSPILLFSIGRGSLALGSFVGLFMPMLMDAASAFVPFGDTTLTVFGLFVVILSSLVLPDEHEIARCVHYNLSDATIRSEESNTTALGEGAQPLGEAITSVEVDLLAGPDDDEDEDEDATGARAGAGAGAGGKPEKLYGIAAFASEMQQHDPNPPRGSKGWFRRNCELVTNCYMLSKREAEVLQLLAKGNNAAAIQNKLYISEGTAKTHIRHIYRKLDVHSQQELIRLVENADRDELQGQ